MIRLRLATLALVSLLACSNHVVPINITVITETCGDSANAPKPTDNVDHYKAVITADDLDPISVTFPVGSALPIEQIPPGQNRVLTLTGYQSDPDNGGTPLAFGQSVPFVVPSNADSPVNATVVLRRVSAFAGIPTVADPTACAHLTMPRAGHTATLLDDGRVLIAGGFSLGNDGGPLDFDTGSNPADWTFLADAEIFDPATNTTTPVHAMQAPDKTYAHYIAFHAASRRNDGTVLVTGGEHWAGDGLDARPDWILYDPATDSWDDDLMQAPEFLYPDGGQALLPRSHHVQFTDSLGDVIIAGGVSYAAPTGGSGRPAQLVPEVLWVDPSGVFRGVLDRQGNALQLGRTNIAATGLLGDSALAIGGGDLLDGQLASEPVVFLNADLDANNVVDSPGGLGTVSDNPVRSHAAMAALGADTRFLLIAGGSGADGGLIPFSSIADSTDGTIHTTLPLPLRARNDACAVSLAGGRALVVGGELPGQPNSTANWADLYGPSDATSGESITNFSANPTGAMHDSRKWQTCTVLKDGSVLVTGGVKEENGQFQVLDSIELYTPVPL